MEQLFPFLTEDDEELAIFDVILNTKDRNDHYLEKLPGVFDLDKLTDSFCYVHFRFYKSDIHRLVAALNIPEEITLKTGTKVKGIEALCILLRRLAYPNRYADMMQFFPRGRSVLSETFNHLLEYIIENKGHVLTNLNPLWLSNQRIRQLCRGVSDKGSPYKHCFAFIDGTVKSICRPTYEQREFYNVHKRLHALKYQCLMLPNGIIYNLFGSVEGRRHDGHMLARSGLLNMLEARFNGYADPPYAYGDLGYPLRKFLITPFKGTNDPREKRVNKKMSSLRISAEWGFAKILQIFAFLDFKKNMKICKQRVAKFFKVGTILTNCHTCLHGSQTGEYFDSEAPLLEEYLL